MAMRLLPLRQRSAIGAIYAFCRAVDDIADGATPRFAPPAPPSARRAALEAWRADIDDYGLAPADFHALIDGMLMDAQDAPLCAPGAATLDLYCERVASAVGRLSVRVSGMRDGDGVLLAHHLGRALQLTNILRHIDEDAALGRVYLARERLLGAGVATEAIEAGAAAILLDAGLPAACMATLARNRAAATRAPRLMAAVYRALLARLPVRVGGLVRAGILVRHVFA